LVENTISLIDISGHYAEHHIKKLIDYGVINGYEDGSFKPNNNITRAEFSTIISKVLENVCGYTLDTIKTFPDIAGHWAENHIQKLATCGIVNGYEDETFRPNTVITRAQAAMIACNMLLYCGLELGYGNGFPDTLGHYAEKHIAQLAELGVVNGYEDGTFKPDLEITRGQAAIIISNCLTVLGK
jgi:hypothetical protein